jgi:pyridoxine 4-dehydrogenase
VPPTGPPLATNKRSPVTIPIPAPTSVSHLEENVAAAGLRLSGEE